MEFIEYHDRDLLALKVADTLASALNKSLKQNDTASFAVPGGTTPEPIFDMLSAASLEWARVCVMLSDERWVPDTHERSNARLVRARLLQGPAAEARFVPFYKDGMSSHQAAPALSEELSAHFPLSVLLLGMGADMHTASLFPGATGLEAAMQPDAPALCAIDAVSQPEPRITLSAPVLEGALEKHLVIFGDEKRAALEAATKRAALEAPISAVMNGGTVHWAA